MLASNSVSTIFRCMSCSFGTGDQTVYAEHIKHCSEESTNETQTCTSDGKKMQSDLSKTVRSRRCSYDCTECHVPMDCSRALLIHLRDVHGKDSRIFVCKLCSHYAARSIGGVQKHAARKHETFLKGSTGRVYAELHKNCSIEELSTNDKAEVQDTSCNQNECNIPVTVKSSSSLGLQFLVKQHPDIGRGGFLCQLCSFSHVASNFVVKHIWKEHGDKFDEVTPDASTAQATDNASVTNVLYRCDDCSYTSRTKLSFYDHCSRHQFKGPSKCPHCSFCALNEAAIVRHVQKYHTSQQSSDLNESLSAEQPKSIRSRISAPYRRKKRSGSKCGKLFVRQKWHTCPYCTFRTIHVSSVYRHKALVHPELHQPRRSGSYCSKSTSQKLKKNDAETSDNYCGLDDQYGKQRCKTEKSAECDDSRGAEFGTQNTGRSETHHIRGNDAKQPAEDAECVYNYAPVLPSKKRQRCNVKAKLHLCEHCPYLTTCRSALLFHRQLHRPRASALYKCDHCALWVAEPHHLIRHTTVHTAEYMQKHTAYSQMQQSSVSLGSDVVKVGSDIHTAASSDTRKLDGLSDSERDERQKPDNNSLMSNATNTNLNAKTFTCDICFVKTKCLSKHKLMHFDLRIFQCPFCGLRGNYRENMSKHIKRMHKGRKSKVIRLSSEHAKQTIEAYKKKFVKLSRGREKNEHSSATERHNKLLHSAAGDKSISLANSSEDNMVQIQEPRMENSGVSNLCAGIDGLRLQKCYACSVCKTQSNHRSSIFRHIRTVHHGRKARIIIVKEKMSVQKTKLTVHRQKVQNLKLNAETSGNFTRLQKQNVKKRCHKPADSDSAEHDDSSGTKFGTQNTDRSKMTMSGSDSNIVQPAEDAEHAVQSSPVKHHESKRYACDICPLKAHSLSFLNDHRKLHVKRAGYSFACKVCPYFACQKAHLERHIKLHAKQSVDSKKPINNSTTVHLCEHCPYMTIRRSALLFHRQLHRPRASALYKCDHCALWVAEPHHLTNHTAVHTAEYMQKRMRHSQLPRMSDSLGSDIVKVASETDLSASGDTNEPEGLPVTTDKGKLDEMTQNKSAKDQDESTVNDESLVANSKANADVSVHTKSSAASRQLPSWCCDRCPYSSNKLSCFKRHVWLHGKNYPYLCMYCDYSVQSYWQLTSHMLWHFAPNKHLVYAQSVSNLDSFPPQLPNRDSIPDSLVSIDRFIPSFENSDVFLLSDVATFQCHYCPFVTEQRSEFFTHMSCHYVQTAAYHCPYCNFHTDLSQMLSAHVLLHFNLPGCMHSSLPPNVGQSLQDWKQLRTAIEAVAERCCRGNDPCSELINNTSVRSYGTVESASSLETDAENKTRTADCKDDASDEKSVSTLRVVHIKGDHTYCVPQPVVSSVHSSQSTSAEKQHGNVKGSTASADSSLAEPHLTNSVTSELIKDTNCCRYCDRIINDPLSLAKHEAHHLIGYNQLLS